MEKQEKKKFITQPAEVLAIKDTLSSLRILIPLVALLQIILVLTWAFDKTGDRTARGGFIYLGGYVFMFLASLGIDHLLKTYSKDIPKYREQIFHIQMTYAWMLPTWTAVLTMLDAINASYTFSTQFYVMANVLTLGICYMPPKKWILIQIVTGLAVLISAMIMPMTEHFTFISELIAYGLISIIAGRFVFRTKTDSYERQAELEAILEGMEYDSLTGVYTRETFFRKAEELLKENPGTPYTMVVSDIDNFKQINSVFGNKTGNEVLCYLAEEYRKYGKLTARYGSDQFISMLMSAERMTDQEMEQVIADISKRAPIRNLTVKYGYYDISTEQIPVSIMCDRALLAAKSIHANYTRKVASYDGPVSQKQLRARRYAADFREAIEKKEFVLWYQPKVDPYTGKAVAAEALVRWQKADGSIMPPGEFMDVFEANGQIAELDEYVFRAVCLQQKKWKEEGMVLLPVSVNLSRRSMDRADLVSVYEKIAEETGISLDAVPIEITESAAVKSVMLRPIVQKLCEKGFRIHIDDFGSGQSSINVLNLFQADVVKIDKSLVDTIGTDSGNIILSGLMDIIKKLGIRIVAEGVEEKAQLEFLIKNCVDEIQGYYYSKPLPPEKFEEFVREKNYPAC